MIGNSGKDILIDKLNFTKTFNYINMCILYTCDHVLRSPEDHFVLGARKSETIDIDGGSTF